MKFNVDIQRTETYVATVMVEACSQKEAESITQDKLDEDGWDAAHDDDGDYDTCYSEVVPKPVP